MSAPISTRSSAADSGDHSNILRRNQGATSSASMTGNVARQQRRRIDDSESNWLDDPWSESDTDYSSSSDAGTYVGGTGAGTTPYDEEALHQSQQQQRPIPSRSHIYPQHAPRSHRSTASMSSAATLYEAGTMNVKSPISPSFERGKKANTHGQTPLISYVTNDRQSHGKEWDEKKKGDDQHPYYGYSDRHNSYHPTRRRRSLSPSCCDGMFDSSSWTGCLRVMWRRLTLRLLVVMVVLTFIFSSGHWWVTGGAARRYTSDGALRDSVHHKMAGGQPRGPRGRFRTWFGDHLTHDFYGVHLLASLNETTDWTWGDGRKLVIIGDVHGSAKALSALLEQIEFDGTHDHLAFTGDLVAKGPDTAGVLDIAIQNGASCVRGNHDDKLLLLRRDLSATLRHKDEIKAAGTDGVKDSKPRMDADASLTGRQVYTKQRDLARVLSDEHVAYLSSCPLVLDLGEVPGLAPNALMVHAGLVPGLALDKQDPSALMNMRSIDLRTYTPVNVHAPTTQRILAAEAEADQQQHARHSTKVAASSPSSTSSPDVPMIAAADPDLSEAYKNLPPPWNEKKAKQRNSQRVFDLDDKYVVPWSRAWEEWQVAAPAQDRTLVVYGHDSALGLNDGDWAVGLDTGCVRGGKLTALVLAMKGDKVTRTLESVDCAKIADGKKGKKKGGRWGFF